MARMPLLTLVTLAVWASCSVPSLCKVGCDAKKVRYHAPKFPVVPDPPFPIDDPELLGNRVRRYASNLAKMNEKSKCNVMIIQQETYDGKPDKKSGYSRKETSNFLSSNTFDIWIFDKATFTNTGDGARCCALPFAICLLGAYLACVHSPC
jgi:hypothetical protein